MKLIILGVQGSGKSTQAALLAKKWNLCIVNAGDLLKEFAKGNHPRSQEVQHAWDTGALVDDRITAALVAERITEADCQNGYIIDGYPRAIESVELFDPPVDKVLLLQLPEQKAKGRLLKRGRKDDTEEAIRQRLELFNARTKPVLDYYRKLGKVVSVDANRSILEVEQEIERSLS